MLFISRVVVRVMARFSVWLVSGYAHVFRVLPVVIVTLPKSLESGSVISQTFRERDNDNGKYFLRTDGSEVFAQAGDQCW